MGSFTVDARHATVRVLIIHGGRNMKAVTRLLAIGTLMGVSCAAVSADAVPPAPNGITIPQGYKDWRTIAVSHRTDNNTLRTILGNDVAINAAREGKTNPWPDGTMMAKVAWKDKTHEVWKTATVPGDFIQAEFMVKDSKKYSTTGGWGFARWVGMDQKPYGKDANFVQECFGCHTPMKNNDYVFTQPVRMP
jgi:Cytochrome P460